MRLRGTRRSILAKLGDPDANAYFAEAGISDSTEKNAVNALAAQLKSAGLWDKMDRIFPISPTSLSAAAYCLKTRTTITWVNTPTHSSSGVLFNGTSQYGNTNYAPSVDGTQYTANDAHIMMYNGNDFAPTGNKVLIGSDLQNRFTVNSSGDFVASVCSTAVLSETGPIDERGAFVVTRRGATDASLYNNEYNVVNSNSGVATTTPSDDFYVGCRNNGGSPLQYSDCLVQFMTYGSGLTDSQQRMLTRIVARYQFALNRLNTDADASDYISNAGISSVDEQIAVQRLTIGLKFYGLWTDLDRIYPISPTSLTAASWDLKNDTQITWVNTPTHSAQGVLFNGTTQYGNTNFNEQDTGSIAIADGHISVYNNRDYTDANVTLMGSRDGTTRTAIETTTTPNVASRFFDTAFTLDSISTNAGFFSSTRRSSTDHEVYLNGASLSTNTTAQTGATYAFDWYIGAMNSSNSATLFSNSQITFACIGAGITDAQAAGLYRTVETYQNNLDREAS